MQYGHLIDALLMGHTFCGNHGSQSWATHNVPLPRLPPSLCPFPTTTQPPTPTHTHIHIHTQTQKKHVTTFPLLFFFFVSLLCPARKWPAILEPTRALRVPVAAEAMEDTLAAEATEDTLALEATKNTVVAE